MRTCSPLRRRWFNWTLALLERRARGPHAQTGAVDRLHAVLHGSVMRRGLQDFLGLTNARFLGSVGAVVAPEALSFFRLIGLPLRNIYSLAEAGGPVAIGGIDEDGDTLGTILPTLEHRIGPAGVLEIRAKASPQDDSCFCGSGDTGPRAICGRRRRHCAGDRVRRAVTAGS